MRSVETNTICGAVFSIYSNSALIMNHLWGVGFETNGIDLCVFCCKSQSASRVPQSRAGCKGRRRCHGDEGY